MKDSIDQIRNDMFLNARAYNKFLTKSWMFGRNLFAFVNPCEKDHFERRVRKLSYSARDNNEKLIFIY